MQDNDKNLISEEDGIRQMKDAYDDFLRKIRMIEKERDEKIMAIIKRVEDKKIEEIKSGIKNIK